MGNLLPGGLDYRRPLIVRLKQLQRSDGGTASLGLLRLFQTADERSAAALGVCHADRAPYMAKELFLFDKKMEVVCSLTGQKYNGFCFFN